MNLIALAIRQPVTVFCFVVLLLMAGVVALSRLPIQLTPTVDSTVMTVRTIWEGASPVEIEQNVIDRQEERLLRLSGLRLMSSASRQGEGEIRLEFEPGTDRNRAIGEVIQRLSEVPDYPANVKEPIVDATDPDNRDYIAWIVLGTTDPDFDIRTLRDFAVNRVEPAIERLRGVEEVNVLGGRERELQVRVDPLRLAQHGVTPLGLVAALRAANQDISGGQTADGKLDVRLRTVGQYRSTEEVMDTVIVRSAGGPVRIRDVGDVVETYKEPMGFVRSRGEQVLAINVGREIGSNVMQVMDRVKAEIDRLNAPGGLLETEARRLGLNGDLVLRQVYDQTVYVDEAIGLVRTNIWIGGSLAVIVLVLFLRSARSVLIIGIAIPISIIGAVVGMVILGRSVNVISLAGMAFAVGLVVDNAIVVLENIFRHLEMGKTPWRASLDGTKEVWGAVLAATLTTVIVFIPILLIQLEAGQLFRDLALAICVAVLLSLVVSITVIPCLAARLLRQIPAKPKVSPAPRSEARRRWWHRFFGKRGEARKQVPEGDRGVSAWVSRLIYRLSGGWVLRPAIILLLTALSIAGSLSLRPAADYLPRGNRNLVFGVILPPPGYNLDQFETLADRIEETVRPFWEAGAVFATPEYAARAAALPTVPTFDFAAGRPGAPVQPPSLENYFLVKAGAVMFHGGISDDAKRTVDIVPLFLHATRGDRVPGVLAFPFQAPLFQLGGASGAAIKLQLSGPSLEEVTRAAGSLYGQLAQRYGYGNVQPNPGNFLLPVPEVQIRPDLVRLSEVGLTTGDIGAAVTVFGDGAIVDEYALDGETIDLRIIAIGARERTELLGLEDLPIAVPGANGQPGGVVPIGSLARIIRTSAPTEIARVNRLRAVTFEITPPSGVPIEDVVREVEMMIAQERAAGIMTNAVAADMEGTAGKLRDVLVALVGDGTLIGIIGSSVVLALIVVYLLMCVLFQSFSQPLVIMFSVPLATLGGFLGLFIVHKWSLADRYLPVQTLDVLTMLGFVLLIGVVVNNAIIIVHQSLNFMRGTGEHDGGSEALEPREAIAAAVRTRVRPIFMGMCTSVGGMLPLVLMPGAGSELYRGLGSVVVGGLLVSTVFTLVLVPLLLSVAMDLGGRRSVRSDVHASELVTA